MNQLKEAERKASQLVQDARKGLVGTLLFFPFICFSICLAARVDRMKEAKVEADQIIAAYRAEMEAVYQRSLLQVALLPLTILMFE
jgi:F0F1-type ATP synthase membrane subunit b/b'